MTKPTYYWCGAGTTATLSNGPVTRVLLEHERTNEPEAASLLIADEGAASFGEFLKVVRPHHTRFFISGEAFFPDFNLFDFALGYDHLEFGDRYKRYKPHFRLRDNYALDVTHLENKPDQPGYSSRNFCDFIYSNPNAHPARDSFFRLLSKQAEVSSLGRHLNNQERIIQGLKRGQDDWFREKIGWQKNFRFSIAFENASYGGYTSEKIFTSLVAGQIPIYWGNPEIVSEMNQDRIINVHAFDSFDSVVRRILEINSDEVAWSQVVETPLYTGSQLAQLKNEEAELEDFVRSVFRAAASSSRRRGIGAYPDFYESHTRRVYKFGSAVRLWLRITSRLRRIVRQHKKS